MMIKLSIFNWVGNDNIIRGSINYVHAGSPDRYFKSALFVKQNFMRRVKGSGFRGSGFKESEFRVKTVAIKAGYLWL
jgi:hypothetical protein